MTTSQATSPARCPWCQLPLPRPAARAARGHRCPAKPQTYYPEDLRALAAPSIRRRRRASGG